ncbi:MAG TPA: bifunctional nuclease family protein [Rectinemataceae bacterium]|nr:bifunctional nuclease family protein [Rectinemataceae bacterium]
MVELRVRGVSVEGPDDSPLVILEDPRNDLRLSVPVGPFEASAIIMELEGINPPRPLTHDLLASFFREGGFSLDRVELFGESPDCPRARLAYRRGFKRLGREVRPSDAIALAVRLDAPLIAAAELLKPGRCIDAAPRFLGNRRILSLDDWKSRTIRP